MVTKLFFDVHSVYIKDFISEYRLSGGNAP